MPDDSPDILMVGTDPQSKGGISSVIRLYQQAPFFNRVLYLASYTDGNLLRKGFYYIGFLARLLYFLATRPSIRIVHIHSASYGSFFRKFWVFLLARLTGKKTILHIHGAEFRSFYDRASTWKKLCISFALGNADAIIALSGQWQDALASISKKPNVYIIHNPTILPKPVDSHENHEKSTVQFLFMGRLGQRKGVYDLIDAVSRINTHNFQVMLYGDGEIEQVRNYIAQRGVQEKVRIGGWISGPEKEKVFRQADVLVLPSYNEGLPIAILEAMAYGKPVIASDVGGNSEAVEDGVNGFLMEAGDSDTLALRIKQLAESDALRQRMGQAGYEKARRQFSLPIVETRLNNLYDQLLAYRELPAQALPDR